MRFFRAPRAVACRHDGTRVFRMLLAAALLAVIGSSTVGTAPTSAKAPSQYYVSDTGHRLGEPFLSHWADNDGLNTLGLPVTEAKPQDGRLAQYFEYGYVQATSKSKNPDKFKIPASGLELVAARHNPEFSVAGKRVGGSRTDTAFHLTDDGAEPTLNGRTKSYYDRHGGEARFGKAISESFVAYGMRVQWFEFGRLQWSLIDKEVKAAPVGLELATVRGLDTSAVGRGDLPKFDPKRFRTFVGDGTVPEAKGGFNPIEIDIPKIAITAAIEQVGIVEGVMQVPEDAWKVGWYESLAQPGDRTNVVMAGHKDWWGIGPVVFWNLEQLLPGDKVYLRAEDGTGSTYVVTESFQVDAGIDAREIIGDHGTETLTLITCGGTFNGAAYTSRHIVRAERI